MYIPIFLYVYIYPKPLVHADNFSSFIVVKLINKVVSNLYNIFDVCIHCEMITIIKSVNTYINSQNSLLSKCGLFKIHSLGEF